MESKPGFDDDLRPKRQRSSWLVRSIGWMISVAVVGGMALSVTAGTEKYRKGLRRALLGARQAALVPRVGVPLGPGTRSICGRGRARDRRRDGRCGAGRDRRRDGIQP